MKKFFIIIIISCFLSATAMNLHKLSQRLNTRLLKRINRNIQANGNKAFFAFIDHYLKQSPYPRAQAFDVLNDLRTQNYKKIKMYNKNKKQEVKHKEYRQLQPLLARDGQLYFLMHTFQYDMTFWNQYVPFIRKKAAEKFKQAKTLKEKQEWVDFMQSQYRASVYFRHVIKLRKQNRDS